MANIKRRFSFNCSVSRSPQLIGSTVSFPLNYKLNSEFFEWNEINPCAVNTIRNILVYKSIDCNHWTNMLRFIVILVTICCISYATADEETEILEKIYQMAQHVVNTTTELQQKNEILEARKISPLHFLFPLCEYLTDEQIKLLEIVKRKKNQSHRGLLLFLSNTNRPESHIANATNCWRIDCRCIIQ